MSAPRHFDRSPAESRLIELCHEVRRLRLADKPRQLAYVAGRWEANAGTRDRLGELVQDWLAQYDEQTHAMTEELDR